MAKKRKTSGEPGGTAPGDSARLVERRPAEADDEKKYLDRLQKLIDKEIRGLAARGHRLQAEVAGLSVELEALKGASAQEQKRLVDVFAGKVKEFLEKVEREQRDVAQAEARATDVLAATPAEPTKDELESDADVIKLPDTLFMLSLFRIIKRPEVRGNYLAAGGADTPAEKVATIDVALEEAKKSGKISPEEVKLANLARRLFFILRSNNKPKDKCVQLEALQAEVPTASSRLVDEIRAVLADSLRQLGSLPEAIGYGKLEDVRSQISSRPEVKEERDPWREKEADVDAWFEASFGSLLFLPFQPNIEPTVQWGRKNVSVADFSNNILLTIIPDEKKNEFEKKGIKLEFLPARFPQWVRVKLANRLPAEAQNELATILSSAFKNANLARDHRGAVLVEKPVRLGGGYTSLTEDLLRNLLSQVRGLDKELNRHLIQLDKSVTPRKLGILDVVDYYFVWLTKHNLPAWRRAAKDTAPAVENEVAVNKLGGLPVEQVAGAKYQVGDILDKIPTVRLADDQMVSAPRASIRITDVSEVENSPGTYEYYFVPADKVKESGGDLDPVWFRAWRERAGRDLAFFTSDELVQETRAAASGQVTEPEIRDTQEDQISVFLKKYNVQRATIGFYVSLDGDVIHRTELNDFVNQLIRARGGELTTVGLPTKDLNQKLIELIEQLPIERVADMKMGDPITLAFNVTRKTGKVIEGDLASSGIIVGSDLNILLTKRFKLGNDWRLPGELYTIPVKGIRVDSNGNEVIVNLGNIGEARLHKDRDLTSEETETSNQLLDRHIRPLLVRGLDNGVAVLLIRLRKDHFIATLDNVTVKLRELAGDELKKNNVKPQLLSKQIAHWLDAIDVERLMTVDEYRATESRRERTLGSLGWYEHGAFHCQDGTQISLLIDGLKRPRFNLDYGTLDYKIVYGNDASIIFAVKQERSYEVKVYALGDMLFSRTLPEDLNEFKALIAGFLAAVKERLKQENLLSSEFHLPDQVREIEPLTLGQKKIVFLSGSRYEGAVDADDKPDGRGVYYGLGGRLLEGEFKAGLLDGEIKESRGDKLASFSSYVAGVRDGRAVVRLDDGDWRVLRYDSGQLEDGEVEVLDGKVEVLDSRDLVTSAGYEIWEGGRAIKKGVLPADNEIVGLGSYDTATRVFNIGGEEIQFPIIGPSAPIFIGRAGDVSSPLSLAYSGVQEHRVNLHGLDLEFMFIDFPPDDPERVTTVEEVKTKLNAFIETVKEAELPPTLDNAKLKFDSFDAVYTGEAIKMGEEKIPDGKGKLVLKDALATEFDGVFANGRPVSGKLKKKRVGADFTFIGTVDEHAMPQTGEATLILSSIGGVEYQFKYKDGEPVLGDLFTYETKNGSTEKVNRARGEWLGKILSSDKIKPPTLIFGARRLPDGKWRVGEWEYTGILKGGKHVDYDVLTDDTLAQARVALRLAPGARPTTAPELQPEEPAPELSPEPSPVAQAPETQLVETTPLVGDIFSDPLVGDILSEPTEPAEPLPGAEPTEPAEPPAQRDLEQPDSFCLYSGDVLRVIGSERLKAVMRDVLMSKTSDSAENLMTDELANKLSHISSQDITYSKSPNEVKEWWHRIGHKIVYNVLRYHLVSALEREVAEDKDVQAQERGSAWSRGLATLKSFLVGGSVGAGFGVSLTALGLSGALPLATMAGLTVSRLIREREIRVESKEKQSRAKGEKNLAKRNETEVKRLAAVKRALSNLVEKIDINGDEMAAAFLSSTLNEAIRAPDMPAVVKGVSIQALLKDVAVSAATGPRETTAEPEGNKDELPGLHKIYQAGLKQLASRARERASERADDKQAEIEALGSVAELVIAAQDYRHRYSEENSLLRERTLDRIGKTTPLKDIWQGIKQGKFQNLGLGDPNQAKRILGTLVEGLAGATTAAIISLPKGLRVWIISELSRFSFGFARGAVEAGLGSSAERARVGWRILLHEAPGKLAELRQTLRAAQGRELQVSGGEQPAAQAPDILGSSEIKAIINDLQGLLDYDDQNPAVHIFAQAEAIDLRGQITETLREAENERRLARLVVKISGQNKWYESRSRREAARDRARLLSQKILADDFESSESFRVGIRRGLFTTALGAGYDVVRDWVHGWVRDKEVSMKMPPAVEVMEPAAAPTEPQAEIPPSSGSATGRQTAGQTPETALPIQPAESKPPTIETAPPSRTETETQAEPAQPTPEQILQFEKIWHKAEPAVERSLAMYLRSGVWYAAPPDAELDVKINVIEIVKKLSEVVPRKVHNLEELAYVIDEIKAHRIPRDVLKDFDSLERILLTNVHNGLYYTEEDSIYVKLFHHGQEYLYKDENRVFKVENGVLYERVYDPSLREYSGYKLAMVSETSEGRLVIK